MRYSTSSVIFKTLFKNLSKKGVFVLAETLKSYKHQGWMSDVFIIESDRGALIIHLIEPIKEHQLNKVWDKFHGLSKILPLRPLISAPHILYSGLIGKTFVLAQDFMPGTRAGKRVLRGTIISDTWRAEKENVLPNILCTLASVHQIRFKKFGWPALHGSLLEGKHTTWKNFFESNYPLWLEELHRADQRLSLGNSSVIPLGKFIRETVRQTDYAGPSVLVHGDAINPSNILVRDKNKVTIVDWEWSILADPAWEFCDLGWKKLTNTKTLEPYFKASGMKKKSDKADFLNRIELYTPLWLLWGTYMHANDSDPDIYIALRKLLLKKVT